MILGRPLPRLRLYLHLTLRCNLRCTYCYTAWKRRDTMPLQVGKDAIDFFVERTDRLLLQFFGGEPLLRFDALRELVDHAEAAGRRRGRPVSLVVVTNGTLLRREVVEFCAEHDIDVSLSLDGNQAAHDASRVFAGGRGSFATVERHFDDLLRLRPYTHVVSVVSPATLPHLADSVRYLLGRGFRSIGLSPDYTHPDFPAALGAFEVELGRAAAAYLEHVRGGGRAFVDAFDDGSNPYARGRCRPGDADFSVDPEGRIYPCCCFVDHQRFPLGSIYGGIDADEAAAFLAAAERLACEIQDRHAACPEGSFCRKGCACTNLVAAGAPDAVAPVTCEIGRVIARVRARVAPELRRLAGVGAGAF
jgi:uncharacterized protein